MLLIFVMYLEEKYMGYIKAVNISYSIFVSNGNNKNHLKFKR